MTKTKGRNVLFIVNASNRYTIAMTDIEPRNWNYYTMYISRVIHGVMQEMGYSEEQIEQYFKLSGDVLATKTHGKKSVGGINRMVMDARNFDKKLEKEAKYQWELSEYLNRDVCHPEGFDAYGYPSEFFKLDMERLGIIPKIFDTRNQVALEQNKVSQDSMPFTVLSSDQETYWGKVPMWYFTPAWIDLRGDF